MQTEILEMVDDEIELALRELSPEETLPPYVKNGTDMLRSLQGRVRSILDGKRFEPTRDEARRNLQAALYGLVEAYLAETSLLACEVEVCQRWKISPDKKTAEVSLSCRKRK